MFRIQAEESKVGEELLRHIFENRFRQKKSTFLGIFGFSGEGKSYSALKIAELVQPDFCVKEQVIYDPTKFLEAIENAKSKSYKVLILDECHAVAPARLWYSFSNIAVSLVASTFRQIHPLLLILVAPNVSWIEKSLREMLNFYAVCYRRWDKVYMKMYEIDFNFYNLADQFPYLKKIVFAHNNKVYKLNVLELSLPSEHLIKEYEEHAVAFKQQLLQRQLSEVSKKIEKSMEVSTKGLDDVINTLIENKDMLFSLMKKKKSGEMKLKRQEIKKLFRLADSEIEILEQKLLEKIKQLGWL
jgi:ABC-type dipeptide/oligopeptide/nickel transport system ATPase component